MEKQYIYLCIDLKSFYASVECVERGLDPMTTKLVVADPTRTEKTICLAVSPALKALGVKNRCRVFEIPKNIEYIMAPPRMKLYIDYSANIYAIYLKYIAKDEIQVYSIDEAFLDVTHYLNLYQKTAKEIAVMIMNDIKETTGITATCGIGTNLYLTKIALDITAKHVDDHIGYLDEELYRKTLWDHMPITDFWRVGPGIAARLAKLGLYSMGQVAHANEDTLYNAFGVDAELLIDHAWGREPTTIVDIKAYRAKTNSISSGQVIACACDFERGLLLVQEMVDLMCLDMVDRELVTNSVSLYIGYSDKEAKPVRGTSRLSVTTNSHQIIADHFDELYRRIIPKSASIKRLNISFNNIVDEAYEQYDLFTDPVQLERERKIQHAVLEMKKKYGKNAILKGMNLQKGAMTVERNMQIGGHKSGEEK
jgi:DNA polymerase V